MPAGSPAVSATLRSAFFVAVLDERAVARLAQPVLVGLVGLARADRLARRGLLAVFRELVGAALHHLHQVPAERRADGLAYLVVLERVHHALEFRHRVPGRDPAEVAALGGARILRLRLRDGAEVLALQDARAQLLELLACIGFR